MNLENKTILVTGGAGLVGSCLARQLAADNDIRVVDDLSNGVRDSVPDDVTFLEGDLSTRETLEETVTADVDAVFHCAVADKYVNSDDPRTQFDENVDMTHALLERMDAVGVSNVAFTSSSTVYGEAPRPTPEDYAPLEPISAYGAAKLAEESLLSVYAHTRNISVWSFRFANVVGPRFGAGVVPDFVEKLAADPQELTILGNGRQEKSYMHVSDCVDAIEHAIERTADSAGPMRIFNLGTRTTTSVDRIADIVSEEMNLDPTYSYTGGSRGWTGDVPKMQLSIEKLSALGWKPAYSSDEAVRRVASDLAADLETVSPVSNA
ncbi:NAD-dependent epimerase/dehydratase family protein [Salinadaptatus halalkaliphilus]|uniref:NAD-dependent epimerase/dehydratase family protein n=1 Tax=Salinadaptatus halalkaliphilus TaxID=2419781 RepID=A0A4V3VLD4_9EURY|nr:NAD-dependent epimerase/dehydratase family protein [Salinadaptatus halalkaliphilus]THE65147.1 NAD-dependent epimerase/dehydratase family protein [Salinadaptatus halalkaliphilus]